MPEWSNGAVSKTVELLVGSGGSNPPLSAEDEEKKLSSLLEQLFFFIFCKARRRRAGMCDRREQIPPKRGMADKVGLVLPPSRPSPSLLGEGLVASLREGSGPVFRQSFLHLLASLPFSFHNGSISRDSLPLRNGFSAASLLWASWTALSPQSPSTTALITAFSCRCGKDRRAHLPKVIRILPDLARLRKVERGGWKRKRGYRRYRGPRAIAHFRKVRQKRENSAHLRKVSRNAEKHDSFRRSDEVSGKLWSEGDAKG